MKLILLRHEKRELYPGFYSKLTEEGLKDSKSTTISIMKLFWLFIRTGSLIDGTGSDREGTSLGTVGSALHPTKNKDNTIKTTNNLFIREVDF